MPGAALRPGVVPVNWKFFATLLGIIVAVFTICGFIAAAGRGIGERDVRIGDDAARLQHLESDLAGVKEGVSELKGSVRVLDERSVRMERDIQEVKRAVSR